MRTHRQKPLPTRRSFHGVKHGGVFLLALSILVVLATPISASETPQVQEPARRTLVIGGDYNYPPHEFLGDNGEPDGYNVEMSRAIARVMGVEVKIVLGPSDQLRDQLERGEIDAIQGILKSPEREAYLDFSAPYAIISQSAFARKGEHAHIGLAQLGGHEVLVQNTGFMDEFLRRNAPEAILVPVDSHVDALRLLAGGKHDFAVVAVPLGIWLRNTYQLSNIAPVSAPLANAPYCYGVRKGNREVLTLIDSGLAILVNTGVQQQLHAKWLGGLEHDRAVSLRLLKMGVWVLVPLCLIIVAVIFWNNALKRKVRERTHELEERQQQLIQADRLASLGILTSGVAHEVNTPNGIILMNLPVLTEAWQDAVPIFDQHCREHGDFAFGGLTYLRLREEIPAMLADMADGARRIRQIVDDLKSYARHEPSGGEMVAYDLNEVVKNALRLADSSIRKATDHFRVDCAADLPPGLGHPQRLTQVAVNLIVNACQALDSPAKGIAITTRYDEAGQRLQLVVSDEGVGIPPEHLSRLTDPFFTTKRESGGTGLGLSVSLSIVSEHGGEMTFASRPGEGTTVTVTLPPRPFSEET